MLSFIFSMSFVKVIIYSIIAINILKFFRFIYRCFIRKRKDFLKRYGNDSWVIVTGATDGIGKSFCEEFAKIGFNIILVSRTLEKLNKVADELKKLNPKIKTEVLEYDFAKKTDLESYNNAFEPLCKNFDVSIIVNNVGILYIGYFEGRTLENYYDMVNVNCNAQTVITKIFVDKMSKRTSRSCFIDISSAYTFIPLPTSSVYSATKSFNSYLTRALAEEYESYNVDFVVVKPFFVESLMSDMKADGYKVITAKQHVNGVLNDVGYEKETYGHWTHKIQAEILGRIPKFLVYNYLKNSRKQQQLETEKQKVKAE